MRIIKKILIVLAVILLLVTAVSFIFFSSHVHMDRSIVINQPPTAVFNYCNDLHNWNSWSPWYELDPNATYTYSGPQTGVGSSIMWESDKEEVGKGKMTITETQGDSLIKFDIDFMERGSAKGSYHFEPYETGTKMTWGFDMEAGMNPVMRIMGGFMDSFMGKDFDRGLKSLQDHLADSSTM